MKKINNFKIVISSGKGGVGKSMLAANLSILFSKKYKTIGLDCDVDAPNLDVWLNEVKNWQTTKKISVSQKAFIDYKKCNNCRLCLEKCKFGAITLEKGRPKINPFLCEGCGFCQEICPQQAIKLKPVFNAQIRIKKTKYGFTLISGKLVPGETGSGKIVDQIKERADQLNPQIQIIDSSPGTGCPVNAALKDANLCLLITEPTISALADLDRVLQVVNYFNIPYKIVINKWDINKKITGGIVKKFKGKILGKISYDKNIFKAVANLVPIMETNLKAKEEIFSIYNKLIKQLCLMV